MDQVSRWINGIRKLGGGGGGGWEGVGGRGAAVE